MAEVEIMEGRMRPLDDVQEAVAQARFKFLLWVFILVCATVDAWWVFKAGVALGDVIFGS